MVNLRPILDRAVLLCFLLPLLFIMSVGPVFGHEHNSKGEHLGAGWIEKENNPPYTDIIRNTGVHCCSENDCSAFPEHEVEVTWEGYKLSTGEVIPHEKVYITPPEHAAKSLYWRCHRSDGSTRCFWAPSGGF